MLVVCNLTPVPRSNYLRRRAAAGLLARAAQQRRDATTAAPAGATSAACSRTPCRAHGRPHSLRLTLPPLVHPRCCKHDTDAASRQDTRTSHATPIDKPRQTAACAPSSIAVLPASTAAASPSSASPASRWRSRRTVFTDGHDALRVHAALARARRRPCWHEVEMALPATTSGAPASRRRAPGRYGYTVTAWVDHFASWRHELERRVDPDDIRIAAQVGAELIDGAAGARQGADRKALTRLGRAAAQGRCRADEIDGDALKALALDETLGGDRDALSRPPLRRSRYAGELPLVVDRARARFCTWYELFPRSAAHEPGAPRHASRDVEARLPYVAEHGLRRALPAADPSDRPRASARARTTRSAPSPATSAARGRSARPKAATRRILPELGTLEDFRRLVAAARELGIEIALDIAFQCAPDHPYVKEHPAVVPLAARRHACSTPRTRRRSTRTSTRSTSRRDDWQALWAGAEERLRLLDRRGRDASSASTTRTPRPSRSGSGCIARDQARASRRDLPGRGLHAAEGHAPAGQARLLAVVHLLHLAQHQGTS